MTKNPRASTLSVGWRGVGDPRRQDREVDFQPVVEKHTALLEAADRRRLEKRQQGSPNERTQAASRR
jgi:hypothetical protein